MLTRTSTSDRRARMTARKSRIDKLEHSLTPKEAAILWMEEAHKIESLPAYASSLIGKPNAAFPLYRLTEQVEADVRRRFKGDDLQDIDWEVRHRVRDV